MLPKTFKVLSLISEAADIGRLIKVYWNLHKNTYSAQSKEKRDSGSNGWFVDKDFYATEIFMGDVKFIVNEKGRQRVIKDKRKNVHSKIEGTRISEDEFKSSIEGLEEVTAYYNPYAVSTFVDFDDHSRKILTAKYAHLTSVETPNGLRGVIKAYL